MSKYKKQIIHKLYFLGRKYGVEKIFSDFVEIVAITIANGACYDQVREDRYLELINSYTKEEANMLPEMLGDLVMAYEEVGFCDLMGDIFNELEVNNKKTGQFFTPYTVSYFMAKLIMDSKESIEKHIAKEGYITLNEPCCGSGSMIVATASVLKDMGINYQHHMLVECSDIDQRAVHMCYIQLSLHGVPAVVKHMNTLTMETWSTWYTPFYYLRNRANNQRSETETILEHLFRNIV